MENQRLDKQLRFILEVDRLKDVLRRSYLVESRRRENSAEHSWHVALMAWLLAEHANETIDVVRVIKMMLIHDIVEIDAGDTYCYDDAAARDKEKRELAAAERIFGLLPSDQAATMHELWEEFERGETPEARFAAALDRVMPLHHNYYTEGRSWQEHGVTKDQVVERNRHIRSGSETLWKVALSLIERSVQQGYLEDGDGERHRDDGTGDNE